MATPYLTTDSANDICLKKDATLCVIYVSPNQENQAKVDKVFKDVSKSFDVGEHVIQFQFMRLDSELEPAWGELFRGDAPPSRDPYVIVMNPGKRKKYLRHEGDVYSAEAITATLDKILNGDARFKAVKGNELPALASKYELYEAKQ